MTQPHPERPATLGQSYAALRYGGASRERARCELSLAPPAAERLEALFRIRRPGKDADPMRPGFARHAEHVAAVRAAGGFPELRR